MIVDANRFELRGSNGLTWHYDETSLSGEAKVSYHDDERGDREATGDQITHARTQIGTFVTIQLDVVPGSRAVYFTVLLPAFDLAGPHEFATLGIETTVLSERGDGPAPVGPLSDSVNHDLHGTARLVETLTTAAD